MVKSPLIRVVLALVLSAALVPDALEATQKKPDILGFRGRPKKRSASRSRSPGRFPESERRYDPEHNIAEQGNGEGAGDNQILVGSPTDLSTIREYRDEELGGRSDNDLARELFGSSDESHEFYVQESGDQQPYNQVNQDIQEQPGRDDGGAPEVGQDSLPAAPDNSSIPQTQPDTSLSSASSSSSSSSSSASLASKQPPTIVIEGTTETTVSTQQNSQSNQQTNQQQGEPSSPQGQQDAPGDGTQEKSEKLVQDTLGQEIACGIPAITQFYRCFNEFRTTKYWYWLKVTCGVGAAVWLFYYAWMTYGTQMADGVSHYKETAWNIAKDSIIPVAKDFGTAMSSGWQEYIAEPVSNAYSLGKNACLTYLVTPIYAYIKEHYTVRYARYNPYCEPPYTNVQSVNGSIPLGACNPNDQTEYFLSGHCSEGAERIAFFH